MAIRVSAGTPERLDTLAKAMWSDIKPLDIGSYEDMIQFLKGKNAAKIPRIGQLMPLLAICIKHKVRVTIWQD